MDVSIIIVNYNSGDLTINCLKSVFEKTKDIDFEIIIVDNDSQDNSCEIIAREFPGLLLIKNKENLGFGKANNIGAKYAKGKYLLLLNNDIILINNAIKILKDFINSNDKAGICGANLYDIRHNPTHSFRRTLPSIFWEINYIFYDKLEKIIYGKDVEFNFKNKILPVAYITGADLMIKREVWDKASGFDPDFFMYYEDAELNYRVKKAGYKIYSVPDAKIIHLSGQSFKVKEKQELMSLKGREMYFIKTHSIVYYYIVCFFSSINISTKLLMAKIRKINDAVKFWQEKQRLWKAYNAKGSC
jgi:GT2 family glycosyltransferase